MGRVRNSWKNLTIKNKIKVFTSSVFIAILAALLFDVWIIKLFMMDFNEIMEDNARSGEIISAINKEKDVFDTYVHSQNLEDILDEWDKTKKATLKSLDKIPLDYNRLGQERYATLYSLKTAYASYAKLRDRAIEDYQNGNLYVSTLYKVYSMQNYLSEYARRFIDVTMREGNSKYKELIPVIVNVPFLVAALGVIIFITIFEGSKMMDRSITVPVLKLAAASRKIAANDFYIDDVVVDNKDEIGELVIAFNKMKYATGEYIRALEDKREALDQLHDQEITTLEIEKQLETMNLELLKSQINPHFLFNTLNVIAGTANLEDAHTTEQMIEALSSLFRYNLKTQAKETILSQELKISRDYMYLQKMRFGSRVGFDIECNVDENVVIVPTFTFQPLLENAVIHGLSPKIEGGRIFVRINQKDDRLIIEIEDTGLGMDEERLEKIRNQLDGSVKATKGEVVGIGIGNIRKRIMGMYEDGRLEIDSVKDKGTKVTIDIPYKGESSLGGANV